MLNHILLRHQNLNQPMIFWRRMSNKTCVYKMNVKAQTIQAVLVQGDDKQTWLPKSQITATPEIYEVNDEVEFEVPVWLAKSNDFEVT